MSNKKDNRLNVSYVRSAVNDDAISKCVDEMLTVFNSLQPRISACKRKLKRSGK